MAVDVKSGKARLSDDGTVTAVGTVNAQSTQATTAGGGAAAVRMGTGLFGLYFGSGAPTISAAKGSLYLRSDGSSASTRAYINTDGGTTWTAITTAA
jgi:hypothetical protein